MDRRSLSLRFALTILVVTPVACKTQTLTSPNGREILAFQSPACPIPAYVPLQTNAADWPCPSASVIQEIDSQVTLQFLQDTTAPTLVCHAADGSADLTSLQEEAYQTLVLIKRLQFDAPLPWTSRSLWDWFTTNVHVIQYTGTQDVCCLHNVPGGVPIGFMEPGGVEGPSGLLPGATFPAGFPIGVGSYVHEARHGYGHDCGDTMDMNIPELGAWGVQYYFDLWLANHVIAPPLSAAERAYALASAEELRGTGAAFCSVCGGI
jgi:hypothetical protein